MMPYSVSAAMPTWFSDVSFALLGLQCRLKVEE